MLDYLKFSIYVLEKCNLELFLSLTVYQDASVAKLANDVLFIIFAGTICCSILTHSFMAMQLSLKSC